MRYSLKILFERLSNRKYVPRTYLSNEVRRSFLDLRDEVCDITYSGRDSEIPKNCSGLCPYYYICKGGNI